MRFNLVFTRSLTLIFKVNKFEDWFVKPGTLEILRPEPIQMQAMLHEINRKKIGIGQGAFHVDEGFIVNVSQHTIMHNLS